MTLHATHNLKNLNSHLSLWKGRQKYKTHTHKYTLQFYPKDSVLNAAIHTDHVILLDTFLALFFLSIFSISNTQIWSIRPLHFSTNLIIAEKKHQYWIIIVKITFYLRCTARCCWSIGYLKGFLCLVRCGLNSANRSFNCPTDIWNMYESSRDTDSTSGSNHEMLRPFCENWMTSESQFLTFHCLETSGPALHCLMLTLFCSQCVF